MTSASYHLAHSCTPPSRLGPSLPPATPDTAR
eukprot:CAMPEP_0202113186 /NCGR_PEP_ID=MMETSP0965-20130614/33370_1 /ASSEMBLY_ACC=CAM_ASM_000507 /TAXON_ID=4773 /ORGANISM="Schizochytrium aggregatum, Strain ATCC28209" /LENGTH=31 /DNA_ID= /DNA_START= /DNA_END= /DNA_ORIENTATION=